MTGQAYHAGLKKFVPAQHPDPDPVEDRVFALAQLKAKRKSDLSAVTLDLGPGKVIQCRHGDESFLRRAAALGIDHPWFTVDDTKVILTSAELLQCADYAEAEFRRIWDEFFAAEELL